jgi:hypothetical protein
MQLQEFLKMPYGIKYLPGHEYLLKTFAHKLSKQRNIVLVAHRGWGKSILTLELGHCLIEAKKDLHVFYFDMAQVQDASTFIRTFLQNFYRSLFIETPDQINSNQLNYCQLDLTEIIAKRKKIQIVFFISNFQQINRFGDNYEERKTLRFIWQKQKRCVYCLSGNNHAFFKSQFSKPGSPLYGFGRVYHLKRNDNLDYSPYVKALFFQHGKRIDHEAALHLTHLTENHLFYLQLLCWHAYLRTTYSCNINTVKSAFKDLLEGFQLHLQNQLLSLSPKQYHFLEALLVNQGSICSRKLLDNFKLGRSSNVAKIKKNLSGKELIEIHKDHIKIVDPLLKNYLRMQIRSQK